MNEKVKKSYILVGFLQNLLLGYLVTGVMLLFLALLLYRFSLSEGVVSIGIVLIYILSTFLAGFLMGKRMKNRKFLWGLLIGGGYFVMMVVITLLMNHRLTDVSSHIVTTMLLCTGSGMLGGMLS